jgi:hypothetical protein
MIQIISHRGYWKSPEEKNGRDAFERSFSMGFGTETDFRDYNRQIVISHDIADGSALSMKDFFEIYERYSNDFPLAINIKADGLQKLLKGALERLGIENYFVFDMSVPDTLGYIDSGIRFFSRQSEYEPQPAFYEKCAGIWLDAFTDIWYDSDVILAHIANGKQVALVSPELHKRDHRTLWDFIKNTELYTNSQIILCTDLPEEAMEYFNRL